jgi:hypothetical protein
MIFDDRVQLSDSNYKEHVYYLSIQLFDALG